MKGYLSHRAGLETVILGLLFFKWPLSGEWVLHFKKILKEFLKGLCWNDGTAHWSAKSKIAPISYFRESSPVLTEFIRYCRFIPIPVQHRGGCVCLSVSTQVQAETRGWKHGAFRSMCIHKQCRINRLGVGPPLVSWALL